MSMREVSCPGYFMKQYQLQFLPEPMAHLSPDKFRYSEYGVYQSKIFSYGKDDENKSQNQVAQLPAQATPDHGPSSKQPPSQKSHRHRSQVQMYKPNQPDGKWWEKLFPCCSGKEVEPEYEDCDYCQRRFYTYEESEDEERPHISDIRMRWRERNRIMVFHDRLHSDQLVKDRWQ